jgi:Rrf2 family protein
MLSNSCRYGIRAIIYLASQPLSGGKTGIKQISKDLDLPNPYLAKILQQLVKQKILSSSKGPHGGFAILKDPKKITVLDIVNAIDGDETFSSCVMHNGACHSFEKTNKPCPLHEEYTEARIDLINLFKNNTIDDMVKRANAIDYITI